MTDPQVEDDFYEDALDSMNNILKNHILFGDTCKCAKWSYSNVAPDEKPHVSKVVYAHRQHVAAVLVEVIDQIGVRIAEKVGGLFTDTRNLIVDELPGIYEEHGHNDDWGVRVIYLKTLQDRLRANGKILDARH